MKPLNQSTDNTTYTLTRIYVSQPPTTHTAANEIRKNSAVQYTRQTTIVYIYFTILLITVLLHILDIHQVDVLTSVSRQSSLFLPVVDHLLHLDDFLAAIILLYVILNSRHTSSILQRVLSFVQIAIDRGDVDKH